MTEVTCPTCGIVVQVGPGGDRCTYDLAQWSQSCNGASFGSPLLCPFIGSAIEALVVKRLKRDRG
jgi:hypothetical protein